MGNWVCLLDSRGGHMLSPVCLAQQNSSFWPPQSRDQELLSCVCVCVGGRRRQGQEVHAEKVFQGSCLRKGTEAGKAHGTFGRQSADTFRNLNLLNVCCTPGSVLDAGEVEKD